MPTYVKKPVTVQAVQFNGSSTHKGQIINWINGGEEPPQGGIHTRDITSFNIETPEGRVTVKPMDYIIKTVKGEFYPCKPDVFEVTYYVQDETRHEYNKK